MIVLGIDPGISGGYCMLKDTGEFLSVEKWTSPDAFVDFIERLQDNFDPHIECFLERVWSRTGQGVKSTFTFGENYGMIQGILVCKDIDFKSVVPHNWQSVYKLPKAITKTEHKNNLKARAQLIWPQHKWTHATADAALIAKYGAYTLSNTKSFE